MSVANDHPHVAAASLSSSPDGDDCRDEASPGFATAASQGRTRVVLEDGVYRSVRAGRLVLTGIDLRYLLTVLLLEQGSSRSVDWLVTALRAEGFAVSGRPSKVVSDALRWEVGRGRVLRLGRGRYASGSMPRQTKSRMRRRVGVLRRYAQAADRDAPFTDGDRGAAAPVDVARECDLKATVGRACCRS
jgi:hypothetical protein